MKVEQQVFINIHMHMIEAEKLLMLLEEVDTSNLPVWAKDKANDIISELKSAGVE